MIVATGPQLTIALPTASGSADRRCSEKMVDVQREHIHSVLESTQWRIRGAGGAADRLGLLPTTLETRMAKLGLTRPKLHELTQRSATFTRREYSQWHVGPPRPATPTR
jgi:DNA-binding NtrC family response regulator